MRRGGAVVGLALALTAVATAVQAQPVLGDRQDGAKIRVPSGSVLDVRLTSNPSTGFTWRMIGGGQSLRLLSQRYDPPPPSRRSVVLVGRPGVQSFRIRVAAPPGRRVVLRFAYRRWWAKLGLARVWTAVVSTQPVGR